MGISWPTLYFGPVNLWTVMPAAMFYASHEEQKKMVWRTYPHKKKKRKKFMTINNPTLKRITSLVEVR